MRDCGGMREERSEDFPVVFVLAGSLSDAILRFDCSIFS